MEKTSVFAAKTQKGGRASGTTSFLWGLKEIKSEFGSGRQHHIILICKDGWRSHNL